MINITLPDGSVKQFEDGASAFDVANSISSGLARNVLSATFNNKTVEVMDPLPGDGNLTLHTWDSAEGKKAFWHSSARLMAQTLLQFYPDAKLTIGPAIENGFYYDVDFGDKSLGEGEFAKIEKAMLENARQKHAFKLHPVSKADALAMYTDNP